MRRVCLSLSICALLGGGVLAQRVVTFEKFQVADTPVGLSALTLDPVGSPQMTHCVLRIETAQVRLMDRRAGTVGSTTGRRVDIGDLVDVTNYDYAVNLRLVKTGSTTGVVQAECWR